MEKEKFNMEEDENDLEENDGSLLEADSASTVCLSVASKTTFLNFTSCTNPTFDTVHREWK